MPRFLPAVSSAVLALFLVSATVAPTAFASTSAPDDDSGGSVTWMVRPSDGVGEDGRAWVELELDPGQAAREHLIVRNLSTSAVTFRLSAADGYFTESGRFNMLTSDTESVDAGTWIDIQEDVDVAAGADAIIPFTITVPPNATPGDHPAGVAASIRSGDGEQVGVESRVGFRVMTRVTGELAPSAAAEVSGEYSGSINPFDAGRIDVGYTVENTGNTRLSILPQVTVSALFGLVDYTVAGAEIVEIAPGESREADVAFPSVWPLFVYTADVVATVVPVGEDLPTGEVEPATARSTVVAMPWSQLVTIVVAGLLVWLLWRDRRRREERVAELVAQARHDALAESAQEDDPTRRSNSRRGARAGTPVR